MAQIPQNRAAFTLLLISIVSLACDDALAALNRAGNTGELIVSPGRIDFVDTFVGDGMAWIWSCKPMDGRDHNRRHLYWGSPAAACIMPNSIIKVGPQRSVKLTMFHVKNERTIGQLSCSISTQPRTLQPLSQAKGPPV